MTDNIDTILSGGQYLLEIARVASLDGGDPKFPVIGQLVITVGESSGERGDIAAAHLSISGKGLPRETSFADGTSGKFTFANLVSEGSVKGEVLLVNGNLVVRLSSIGTIHYFDEYLFYSLDGATVKNIYQLPHPLYEASTTESNTIFIQHIGETAAPIETLEVALFYKQPFLLNGPLPPSSGCDEPHWRHERVIFLQPLRLIDQSGDLYPTGKTWQAQFDKAKEVWRNAGVLLMAMDPPLLWPTTAILAQSPDAYNLKHQSSSKVFNGLPSISEAYCVDVFLVDSKLMDGGEGGAIDLPPFFLAGAKIIVCDQGLGNNTLLAHELVHVLKGTHIPAEANPVAGQWGGEFDTITEPSGTPLVGGSEVVTFYVADKANSTDGPMVFYTGNQICLTPSD